MTHSAATGTQSTSDDVGDDDTFTVVAPSLSTRTSSSQFQWRLYGTRLDGPLLEFWLPDPHLLYAKIQQRS